MALAQVQNWLPDLSIIQKEFSISSSATRVDSMASDDSQVTDDAAHRAIGPAQPEIGDLLGIARRGWLFMAAGTTFGLVCALIILSMIPPTYKASARIVFERTLPRYMQTNKVTNEPIIDDYDT